MFIHIYLPGILQLQRRLFESRRCLLLVCRDDFNSKEFTTYEMVKGCPVWRVSGVFRLAFDPRKSIHYKRVQAGGESEGLNRELKHCKLNIKDHDHLLMTSLEIPHWLHRGRNFLESFGGPSNDPILLLMEIPHMLHLEGKFFESCGCLLLVCKDDIGSTEFTIYEMIKGSFVWSVRGRGCFCGDKLIRRGCKIRPNIKNNIEIFDIGSNQIDDDDDADDAFVFISPFKVDPNLYEFIPSLAIAEEGVVNGHFSQLTREHFVSVLHREVGADLRKASVEPSDMQQFVAIWGRRPMITELRSIVGSSDWTEVLRYFCRMAAAEDRRFAMQMNLVRQEVADVCEYKRNLSDELCSVKSVIAPMKAYELLNDTLRKDEAKMAQLRELERQLELRALEKELFIQKLVRNCNLCGRYPVYVIARFTELDLALGAGGVLSLLLLLALFQASDEELWRQLLPVNNGMVADVWLAGQTNRAAIEINDTIMVRDQFLEELDSLGVRHRIVVVGKAAEFVSDTIRKDNAQVEQLREIESQMEFRALEKELHELMPKCKALRERVGEWDWSKMIGVYYKSAMADDFEFARRISVLYQEMEIAYSEKLDFIRELEVVPGVAVEAKTTEFLNDKL
nr:hypothetical protein [Tanacetum cinerariifolium]